MGEEFIVTTAIKKLYRLKKRKKVIQGGTSAAKTFSILPILIDRALKTPMLEISVVAESVPHLRRGALKDFLKILILTGRYSDNQYNRSTLKYTFLNGSYIEFFSVDQPDKLRGARRNILYVNEANNVPFDSYNQLAIRTNGEIWIDFNPTSKFWAHTELRAKEDCDFIILTYEDNEALDQAIVDDIMAAREKGKTSKYWANWWKVYGLGQIGSLEGACIPEWDLIKTIPKGKDGDLECRLLGYGMDFGFTNDPTTLIAIYKWNDAYIFDEVIYNTGMLNQDISEALIANEVEGYIYADSAEPKTIAELNTYNHTVLPCKKGKDSIVYGINLINQNKIYVTERSLHIQEELQNYIWQKDKENNVINKPIETWNHCFIGETLITTINGDIPIKDIVVGDMVLTSNGYKPVLKTFDNGVKQVNHYQMQYGTIITDIHCTDNHKFKTDEQWTEAKQLQVGQRMYLHKNSMVEPITYTKTKDISVKVEIDYIQKYGSFIMDKFQKVSTYITGMVYQPITQLKTWSWLMVKNIYKNTQRNDMTVCQMNGKKTSIQRELSQPKNGMEVKMGLNGIANTVNEHGIIESLQLKYVKNVEINMKQDMVVYPNTAITTAKLNQIDVVESYEAQVYDIMVGDDTHEYFANGVLVHNCIDAIRYGLVGVIEDSSRGTYNVW